MKPFSSRILLSTLLALAATAASAQEAAPKTTLPGWEQLSPAQRELLIAPIRDRWNREPEQRERFLERAKRWGAMPDAERTSARRGMHRWENMTPEQRDSARALFHATRGMSKQDRQAFLEHWHTLSPPQRAEWLKAHPAPPRDNPPKNR